MATPRRDSRPPPRCRDRDRVVAGGDPFGGLDQAAVADAHDRSRRDRRPGDADGHGGDGGHHRSRPVIDPRRRRVRAWSGTGSRPRPEPRAPGPPAGASRFKATRGGARHGPTGRTTTGQAGSTPCPRCGLGTRPARDAAAAVRGAASRPAILRPSSTRAGGVREPGGQRSRLHGASAVPRGDRATSRWRSAATREMSIQVPDPQVWGFRFWRRPGRPMRALSAPRVRSRTLRCARSHARLRLRLDPQDADSLLGPHPDVRSIGRRLMPATVIVGLQWGDEGKGKTTDFLAEQVAMVVRYQGGDNAGHTVVSGDEVFKLRLTPSGVLYPHITSVIGNGVVVNPLTLIAELDMLAVARDRRVRRPGQPQRARDHAVPRRARPGQRGPARPRPRSARPAGGSGRPTATVPGGSACAWRTSSIGRSCDERIERALPDKNLLLGSMGRPDLRRRAAGRAGAGLGRAPARPPRRHDLARPGGPGARRARPARGGAGHAARPRPRELPVRDLVQPGRRRRVHRRRDRAAPGRRGHRGDEGVLDAGRLRAVSDRAARRDRGRHRRARPRVRDGHRAAATGRLVRRRPAALRGRGQQRQQHHAQQARHPVRASRPIRLCVAYELDGRRVETWPSSGAALSRATPIYAEFPGWSEPIHDVRSLADLPENARRYLSAIEEHAGVPIVLVSVGPERTQTIERAWRPMRHRPGLPA